LQRPKESILVHVVWRHRSWFSENSGKLRLLGYWLTTELEKLRSRTSTGLSCIDES
jgi:hypothetical protein